MGWGGRGPFIPNRTGWGARWTDRDAGTRKPDDESEHKKSKGQAEEVTLVDPTQKAEKKE